MFSSRTQWDPAPNRLYSLLSEKYLHGESIADLTDSNPTRCGFSFPTQDIISAFSAESASVYQPESRGLPCARMAISEYYEKQNISVNPNQIIITASTSEAYSFLFKLLCDYKDEVLVPHPSYPLFEYLCQLNDVGLRKYNLNYDGEWHIDLSSLEESISPRTKAIALIHPNNPTGSFVRQYEFEQLFKTADKHGLAIIVDEVFNPYAFSKNNRNSSVLKYNPPELLFCINGISKLLGLPQFKLAWIIAAGNKEKNSEALDRLEIISDTFLSVNTSIQTALPRLLSHSSSMQDRILERVRTNYSRLQGFFSGSKISVFQSEGGWHSILQLPQIMSDDEWSIELLSHCNTLVYPGHFFEISNKSAVVISLLPESNVFDDGIGKLFRFVQEK